MVSNTFSVIGDGSDLASWFREFGIESLETMSLEVFDIEVSAATNNESRLGMRQEAEPQLDIFRGIGPEDVVPKRVNVALRGPSELRSAVEAGLADVGFGIGRQSSASVADQTTRVLYGLGGDDAATLVAAFLGGPIDFVASDEVQANSVIVELGPEAVALTSPRVLESRAPVIAPPTTPEPPATDAPSPTTVPEHPFAFNCAQSTAP